eukprot:172929-Chlamydomonas_euryale.AAC.2
MDEVGRSDLRRGGGGAGMVWAGLGWCGIRGCLVLACFHPCGAVMRFCDETNVYDFIRRLQFLCDACPTPPQPSCSPIARRRTLSLTCISRWALASRACACLLSWCTCCWSSRAGTRLPWSVQSRLSSPAGGACSSSKVSV